MFEDIPSLYFIGLLVKTGQERKKINVYIWYRYYIDR